MNNLATYFSQLGGWSWLILGGVLLVIEVLAPGVFMLWFGLAALVTGLVVFAVPIGFEAQLLVFVLASLVSVLVGRRYFTGQGEESDQPLLNQKGSQLIGNSYVVTKPIEQGSGKVKVGDTVWSVSGPDTKAGERVRVIGVDGNRLTVEAP